MTIKEAIDSVLTLQPEWTSKNSAAMQQRGELIRNALPRLLRPLCTGIGLQVAGSFCFNWTLFGHSFSAAAGDLCCEWQDIEKQLLSLVP